MTNFKEYSAFYDLLYRDKDYVAEADYVAAIVRSIVPNARSILELGSGTGRHGRLLAAIGFDVHGIERSPEMVSLAQSTRDLASSGDAGAFTCEVGDICEINLGRTFDAVISLFHVISYQTSNDSLLAAFRVAAQHLAPGGVFVFDVWHGPAVLSQTPSRRIKEVADEHHRVKRTASPELDSESGHRQGRLRDGVRRPVIRGNCPLQRGASNAVYFPHRGRPACADVRSADGREGGIPHGRAALDIDMGRDLCPAKVMFLPSARISSKSELLIRRTKGWLDVNLTELWRCRDLLSALTERGIKHIKIQTLKVSANEDSFPPGSRT